MRGLDAAELQRQQQDGQEQLFRLRFQMGMGHMEGIKKYRALKKDRARMLTVLAEKGVEAVSAPAPAGLQKAKTSGKKKPGGKKK